MAIDVTVQVGGRDVVASGVLTTGRGERGIVFRVSNLRIDLQFETRGAGEPKIESTLSDQTTLNLKLVDFDSSFGLSIDSKVGQVDNRALYVAFTTALMGEPSDGRRVFNYTFSLGEVSNG